ncbi:MAG TPA: hypothetical protein VFK06_02040 [Candidatus Angelobacter sp.]|nr:hypothetical protein [Candidatus Angelobacter sp.]
MKQSKTQKKFGLLMREWLGDKCPVCKKTLAEHHYTRVGVVVSESAAHVPFIRAFREHRWNETSTREFIPTLDALGGNVLKCPLGQLA